MAVSVIGTPKIYTTTTGFGPRKNREMAGVDDLVVYMQTAVKYDTFYIHHPGGASRPPGWCIYKTLYFTAVFIYTTKSSTPAISLFFLGPNPVVVYIFGVSISIPGISSGPDVHFTIIGGNCRARRHNNLGTWSPLCVKCTVKCCTKYLK